MARNYSASTHIIQSGDTVTYPTAMTVACWERCTSQGDADSLLCTSASVQPAIRWEFSGTDSMDMFRQFSGAEARWRVEGWTINSVWRHVCWTHDGGLTTATCYKDGAVQSVNEMVAPSGSFSGGSGTWGIGNEPGESRAVVGDLAHMAIWEVELTAAEVAALAAGFSPLAIRPVSLHRYWPLDGQNPEVEWIAADDASITGATVVTGPSLFMPTSPLIVGAPSAVSIPGSRLYYQHLLAR